MRSVVYILLFSTAIAFAEVSPENYVENYRRARTAWSEGNWSTFEIQFFPLFRVYRGAELWRAHFLWGVMLLRSSRFELAQDQFRRAELIAPDDSRRALTLYHQAVAEAYAGKTEAAFDSLRKIGGDTAAPLEAPTLLRDSLFFGALIAYQTNRRPLALLMAGYGMGDLTSLEFRALLGGLPADANVETLASLLNNRVSPDKRSHILALEPAVAQWQPMVLGDAFDLPEPGHHFEPPSPESVNPFSGNYRLGVDLLSYHQRSENSGDRALSTTSIALGGGLAWKLGNGWSLLIDGELQLAALASDVVAGVPREMVGMLGVKKDIARLGSWRLRALLRLRGQTMSGTENGIGYKNLSGPQLGFDFQSEGTQGFPMRAWVDLAFFGDENRAVSSTNTLLAIGFVVNVWQGHQFLARSVEFGARLETLKLYFSNGSANSSKTSVLGIFHF